MVEEFAAYGLSENAVYVVGAIKVLAALGLLGGLFDKRFILPSALVMAVMMLGALGMHFKIGDEAIKYVPSLVFFLMSAGIIFLDRDEKKKSRRSKKARFVDHS